MLNNIASLGVAPIISRKVKENVTLEWPEQRRHFMG